MAGIFSRLKTGLARSSAKINTLFTDRPLDPASLEELEEELLAADLGPVVARAILEKLRKRQNRSIDGQSLRTLLEETITEALTPLQAATPPDFSGRPSVLLMVGVNGTGKTTSTGKLGAQLKAAGKKVGFVAGDTFRAAATEQLRIWGERAGIPVFAGQPGMDAAALAHTSYLDARRQGLDALVVDTAGRLHNKSNLMEELSKIIRVLKRLDPDAPHNTFLTLDATTGQNALEQVKIFREMADINGLIITKLDGTARGGIAVALAGQCTIPILYVGVGEKVEDLQPFSARAFAKNLVGAR